MRDWVLPFALGGLAALIAGAVFRAAPLIGIDEGPAWFLSGYVLSELVGASRRYLDAKRKKAA